MNNDERARRTSGPAAILVAIVIITMSAVVSGTALIITGHPISDSMAIPIMVMPVIMALVGYQSYKNHGLLNSQQLELQSMKEQRGYVAGIAGGVEQEKTGEAAPPLAPIVAPVLPTSNK